MANVMNKDLRVGDFLVDTNCDAGHYIVAHVDNGDGTFKVTFIDVYAISTWTPSVQPGLEHPRADGWSSFSSWQPYTVPQNVADLLRADGWYVPTSVVTKALVALNASAPGANQQVIASQAGFKKLFGPNGRPVEGKTVPQEPRARIKENAAAGRLRCSKCGGALKELFTSRYCPTCE